MFTRLINRWRKAKEWRKTHITSFLIVSTPNQEGVTPFQTECLAAITSYIPSVKFEKAFHADGTVMFSAVLPGKDVKIFIYDNEAGLYGAGQDARFEEWDFLTPNDLIASVTDAVQELYAT